MIQADDKMVKELLGIGPLPKPGDFQLCPILGTGGKIIRFAQWLNGDGFHDFEHAKVYLGTTVTINKPYGVAVALPGRGWFAEAMPNGAVIAEHDLEGPGLVWSSGIIPLTNVQRDKIVNAALGYIGVGYSYLDYVSLATKRLGIPAPGLRPYIKATGHMICSQYVARCYYDGGAALFDGWTGDVTPGDLYHVLESRKT